MRTPLLLGFLVILLFVGMVAVLAYRSALDYRDTQMWVTHTYRVLEELTSILADVRDAESSTRGYIATGDEAYLKPYQERRSEILSAAVSLRQLVRDNPSQVERTQRLASFLKDRVDRFDELIRIRKVEGTAAASAGLTPGRVLSEKARGVLIELENEERSLLSSRVATSDRSLNRTMSLFSVLAVAAVGILGVLFLMARHSATVRQQSEEDLRRSEQRLQDLYNNAPCAYFSVDGQGTLVKINATALQWLKAERSDIEGRLSLTGIVAPEFQASFAQQFAALREGRGRVDGTEIALVRRDGSTFPVRLHVSIEKDASDAFLRARIAAFDISERKRIEMELDQFFTTSLDLLGVADLATGRFTRVSPSWEKTLGWSASEIVGRPRTEYVHPDDLQATIAEGAKLGRGHSTISFENRYRCKDGTWRWLSWKTPAPLPGSSVLYAVARDVTSLKEQETEIRDLNSDLKLKVEEALAANRELESFSYSVSHDLRAPLRAIDGFSRILIEDCGDQMPKDGRRLLDLVCASSRQMGTLIDDLLQYSRLGRKEVEATRVDMDALARDALDEVRKGQPDRTPAVEVDALPAVRGDRLLLKQVWVNLISNAFKYSGKNPAARVQIGARQENGHVIFHVRDNGVGFDMQYVDKLFGVFQRLHGQKEFEGTGVGLAIVQRVAGRHGGKAWAEGKTGEGAVFYFSIPASGDEP